MKRTALLITFVLMFALPFAASAHQHATYTIGGENYNFVVGSLNEPIVVDDKTGLDLTVTKGGGHMTMSADGDMDEPSGPVTPVTGLEETLKVELIAGDKKLTQDISPVYGKLGSYKTTFYPTVATTFSYRIFGEINKTPVDITFTCLPEGATRAADDHTSKQISEGVTQTSIGGAFGCAMEKEALGFPEQSASLANLASASSAGLWAVLIGAAGVLLGLLAMFKRK
jgi:hypothetical protein